MNNWTVNGTTQLNKRVDVTDEVYVSNKKLKSLIDANAAAQPPSTPTGGIDGGYEFTASTQAVDRQAYKAFGKSIFPFVEPNRWLSQTIKYNTDGSYRGTATTSTNGGAVNGEWVQIKLPTMFRARSWFYNFGYAITTLNTTVCGSTDGVNFIILGFGNIQTRNVYNNLPNPGDYTYYRVIVTANTNYDSTSLWYVHFLTSNPNADWSATSGAAQILNKPTIPVQVNADWNATSGTAQILSKPSIPSQPDWNATTGTAVILNRPVSIIKNVSVATLALRGSYNSSTGTNVGLQGGIQTWSFSASGYANSTGLGQLRLYVPGANRTVNHYFNQIGVHTTFRTNYLTTYLPSQVAYVYANIDFNVVADENDYCNIQMIEYIS